MCNTSLSKFYTCAIKNLR